MSPRPEWQAYLITFCLYRKLREPVQFLGICYVLSLNNVEFIKSKINKREKKYINLCLDDPKSNEIQKININIFKIFFESKIKYTHIVYDNEVDS